MKTVAESVLGVVSALRPFAQQVAPCGHEPDCHEQARAALAAWEQRPRLRDDLQLRELAAHLSNARGPGFAANGEMVGVFLDCVESVLFGTPWPGTERPSDAIMAEAKMRAERLLGPLGTGPRPGGEQGEGGDRGVP